jgi:membrane protease YdiL (CAAX protease family)
VEPVVNLRRVLAGLRRELTHRTNLASLAAFAAIAAGAGLFALAEAGARVFTYPVFLVLPALACPLAAARVAADREQGMTRVEASPPLSPTEALAGRLVAFLILLSAALLLALPTLYASTEPVAEGAFAASLGLAAWALVVGLAGLLVGVLVGHLHDGSSTGALSVGSAIVLAWLLVADQRHRLLGLADEGPQAFVTEVIVKADPIAWAFQAQHVHALGPQDNHVTALLSLLALVGFLLVITVALVLGARQRGHDRLLGRPWAASAWLGVGLAGLLVTLAAVSLPAPPPEPGPRSDPGGEMGLQLDAAARDRWDRSTPLEIELRITGPINRSLTLEELELASPHLALDHDLATPAEIRLDEPADPEAETGLAQVETTATGRPTRLASTFLIEATASFEGETVQARTETDATDWATPAAGVLPATLLPVLLNACLFVFGPRRWNRW